MKIEDFLLYEAACSLANELSITIISQSACTFTVRPAFPHQARTFATRQHWLTQGFEPELMKTMGDVTVAAHFFYTACVFSTESVFPPCFFSRTAK